MIRVIDFELFYDVLVSNKFFANILNINSKWHISLAMDSLAALAAMTFQEALVTRNFLQLEKEEIDNKALYETLGVPINATEAEIRKAYKKLARENHPDRGGDTEKFKEISLAYEVIGDKDKRELYDRYGLEGIKNGGGGGAGGMSDLFEMFGMGGGGRRQQQRKKKVKPTVKEVTVTLEDVYTGKMLKIKNRKTCLCEECHGKGGEGVKKCSDCNGQGMVVKMRMLGPNMYTQSQEPCRECKGQGEVERSSNSRLLTPRKSAKHAKEKKLKLLIKRLMSQLKSAVQMNTSYRWKARVMKSPELKLEILLLR